MAEANVIVRIKGDASSASGALDQVSGRLRGVQREGTRTTATANQFGNAMKLAMAPVATLGVGLRQLGQMLQSVGWLTTAFISVPMALVLREAARTAITYDDALIRVQKTTELSVAEMGRLRAAAGTMNAALQDIARVVATPIEQLAELAEQAGQLGVTGVENIQKYVRVAEIIGTTTDVAATDAIRVFGRLATAIGIGADNAGEYILKLATTVNYLENTTTAAASDIVTSMERMIFAASGMQIASQDLAAIAASLYSVGIGAEEAGTAFARMTQYVVTNADKIATSMGISAAEVRSRFDEDFTGAFLDLLKSISQVESNTEKMAIATEIFGMRASRGIVALAETLETNLVPNLREARREFQAGYSLIEEYNRATQSTQYQLGILSNNLKIAALTLGETFLPILNQVIPYLVAGVQLATEAFSGLPDAFKIGAVAAAAFLVVLGPLTMILGTLAFAVGIGLTGLANLAALFVGLVGPVLSIVSPILAVGAALVGLAFIAGDAMVKVRDIILSYADAADSWGENLVANIAAGMLRGIAWVINAAIQVANAIARFFRSASPPKEGPLAQIIDWGRNLIETFMKAMTTADFDILDTVTGIIEKWFQALADLGQIDAGAMIPGIVNVRNEISELLSVFKETGEIATDVLDRIRSGLGAIGAPLAQYLSLQLQVNQAEKALDETQKRLEEIRKLREQINDTYAGQVRAITQSGKPLLEQLRLIRQARLSRDAQLDQAEQDEKAQSAVVAEHREQVDVLREQLDMQRALMGYYQKNLDLLAQQAKLQAGGGGGAGAGAGAGALDELAGALDNVQGAFSDVLPTIGEWGSTWDDFMRRLEGSVATISKARQAIEAFFKGLRGEALVPEGMISFGVPPEAAGGPPGVTPDVTGAMQRAFELGEKIRDVWDRVVEVFDQVKTKFDEFKTSISNLGSTIDGLDLSGITDFFQMLKNNAGIIAGIAAGLGALVLLIPRIGSLTAIIFTLTGLIKDFGLGGLISSIGSMIGAATGGTAMLTAFGTALAIVAGIVTLVVAAVQVVTEHLADFKQMVVDAWGAIKDAMAAAGTSEALQELGQAFGNLFDAISPILVVFWTLLKGFVEFFLRVFGGMLPGVLATMIGFWTGFIRVLTGAINIVAGVIGLLVNTIGLVIAIFSGFFTGNEEAVNHWAQRFLGSLRDLGTGIIQILTGAFQMVSSLVIGVLGNFVNFVVQIIGSLWETITGKTATFADTFSNGIQTAINTVVGFFTELYNKVVTAITNLYNRLVGGSIIPDMCNRIIALIKVLKDMLIALFIEAKDRVIEKVAELRAKVIEYLTSLYNQAKTQLDNLRAKFDEVLGAIGNAWEGLKATISTAIETLKTKLGELVATLEEIYNKIVGRSIIPDLVNESLAWFSKLQEGMSQLGGDMTASLAIEARGMPEFAFAGVEALPAGPLVEIGNVIVPNQQVGREFAESLADELARMTRVRRTGA